MQTDVPTAFYAHLFGNHSTLKTYIFLFALICAGLLGPVRSESAESLDTNLRAFFTTYCVKCHGPDEQEADFRVDRLRVSESASDAEYWQLVLDNLHLGEMPPEDEEQPVAKEREAITSWIEAELRRARRVLSGESGEVVLRRLNRTEYEYTIEDLPVLLIGGRFNHGQHLAFDPSTVPLSNLYVNILNQFGLADKSFGSSTGSLQGLEIG